MLKIKNFSFIYFIILLSFFRTDYFTRFVSVSMIFNLLRILSYSFIVIIIFKERKISKTFLKLILFSLTIIVPTFLYNGNIGTALNYFISLLCLAYLIDLNKKNIKFLNTLLICFELLIYANFFSMILFPKGLYSTGTIYTGIASQNWILGFKNVMISYFLPAYIVGHIYNSLKKSKIRIKLLNIIIFLSCIISGSSTSIVGMSVIVILNYLPFIKNNTKLFNLRNYFWVSIILFFIIVIFRFQNAFGFIIVDILHKDLTFTNRTFLWDITLEQILKKPFIGYGWENIDVRHTMYNSQTVITAHNQILEYLYMGGIISILVYVYIILSTCNKVKNNYNNDIIKTISSCFFVLLILNLTEVYLNPIIMLVFLFTIYSNDFISENKEIKNDKIINYNSSI